MSKPRNRTRAKPKADKKYFTNTALRVHPKNVPTNPMRGGIRL